MLGSKALQTSSQPHSKPGGHSQRQHDQAQLAAASARRLGGDPDAISYRKMADRNQGASHRQQQQAEPVQPLQQACEQSVQSVQLQANDTMRHNQSVLSDAAENIEDSMDVIKMKAAAANADQGLVASAMNGQTPDKKNMSKASPSRTSMKEKTTTLKQLFDSQSNLLSKCSDIMRQVENSLLKSEKAMSQFKQKLAVAQHSTFQKESETEAVIQKYALMKEQALCEVFNIDKSSNASSKNRFVPCFNAEQQVLILGLLRFRVLSPQHFKSIFGEQIVSEYNPYKDDQRPSQIDENIFCKVVDDSDEDSDYIDDKNEVPFIREFEDNDNLSKLAPSFQKLEELNRCIGILQKEHKALEKEKNSYYFGRSQEQRKIVQHRNDKRILLEQISSLQTNIKEIEKRKIELAKKGEKQSAGILPDQIKVPMSDYVVGKCLHSEKRVHECINKLNYIKRTALMGKQESEDLLSSHMQQTMISRNQLETEFMKKKIHFVSEFRLYDNDTWQGKIASTHREEAVGLQSTIKVAQTQRQTNTREITSPSTTSLLGALISGRSTKNSGPAESKQTPDIKTMKDDAFKTHQKVTKGTALSVFKQTRGAVLAQQNKQRINSPPRTRRESDYLHQKQHNQLHAKMQVGSQEKRQRGREVNISDEECQDQDTEEYPAAPYDANEGPQQGASNQDSQNQQPLTQSVSKTLTALERTAQLRKSKGMNQSYEDPADIHILDNGTSRSKFTNRNHRMTEAGHNRKRINLGERMPVRGEESVVMSVDVTYQNYEEMKQQQFDSRVYQVGQELNIEDLKSDHIDLSDNNIKQIKMKPDLNSNQKRQQRQFKVSADPYGTKQGDDDDVINITNGEISNSSQVHFEPVIERQREKRRKMKKQDTMRETYGRSTNTNLPHESDHSSMSLNSTQKKLRKLPKGKSSPMNINKVQSIDTEGYETLAPVRPQLIGAKTKQSNAGCLSCFGMGSVNKGATFDKSNGQQEKKQQEFLIEKKGRR